MNGELSFARDLCGYCRLYGAKQAIDVSTNDRLDWILSKANERLPKMRMLPLSRHAKDLEVMTHLSHKRLKSRSMGPVSRLAQGRGRSPDRLDPNPSPQAIWP